MHGRSFASAAKGDNFCDFLFALKIILKCNVNYERIINVYHEERRDKGGRFFVKTSLKSSGNLRMRYTCFTLISCP